MKNEQIARMLRYYRNLKQLSVKDVSDLLERADINAATKTIYAWESGRTQPDADTLLYLCKIYGIDNILETFGYKDKTKPPFHPTTFEESLILSYRAHPEVQAAVDKLLELE